MDLFQNKHARSIVVSNILNFLPKIQSKLYLDIHKVSNWLKWYQIGVGLMVCQQSVGINGIGFYTSETFVAAGKFEKIHVDFEKSK